MLAGADELDFDDEHKTIAEIDLKMAQPGDTLADVFELNDIIIDVENKSLTHRPDCFGLIGFAREIAGILGLEFKEPEWPELKTVKNLPISVEITNSDACPRYDCAVFANTFGKGNRPDDRNNSGSGRGHGPGRFGPPRR